MTKEVFVVKCSEGMMDDYHWWIAGIYDNEKEAQELSTRLDFEAEVIRNACPPFVAGDNDEDINGHYEYYFEHSAEMERHTATVVKYALNKAV